MEQWSIGASTCGREIVTDKLFEAYAQAGIGCMEVSLMDAGDYENPDDKAAVITSNRADQLVRMAEAYGVTLWSLHLPFGEGYYDISCAEDDKRRYAVNKYAELIRYTAQIGAKFAVVHPSYEPIEDKDRAERLKLSADALHQLSKTARECGVAIAVENLPRTCLGRVGSEILYLLSADDSLRACFDVNHLLMQSHKDFVSEVGDKIATLHISDYDFVDERHWIPGKGKIDWKDLVGLLQGIGYSGPFMNEIVARFDNEEGNDLTYSELCELNKKLLEKYFTRTC